VKDQPGVMLYFDDIQPAMQFLNDQEKGRLLTAILDFAQYGEMPSLETESPVLQLAFATIKPHIEKDRIAYIVKGMQNAYAAWKRDNQGAIDDFGQWIYKHREKYQADILQAPPILEKILAKEANEPANRQVITNQLSTSNDITRYQTISDDIACTQPQPQPQPQRNLNTTPTVTSTATPTPAASETERTSTGETFDAAKVKALELLNRR